VSRRVHSHYERKLADTVIGRLTRPGLLGPHQAYLRQRWDEGVPDSSGAVEGHVNRIKMIKRQMYGRAKPDLLRKRVLLAD